MGRCFFKLIVIVCFIHLSSKTAYAQKDTVYETLKEGFRNPPASAHPKVY